MKLLKTLILLSTTTSTLAAVFPRDVATILKDLGIISNQTQKVYNDILAYNDTTNSALTIYSDSNTLDADIQNGTKDASASAVLSDADSVKVANAVVGFQPLIFQTLQALVDRKQGFTAATLGFDATGLVESSVTNQRTDTTYFSNNVTAKLSSTLARLSPLLTSNIDFHFVRAQQAFATP